MDRKEVFWGKIMTELFWAGVVLALFVGVPVLVFACLAIQAYFGTVGLALVMVGTCAAFMAWVFDTEVDALFRYIEKKLFG